MKLHPFDEVVREAGGRISRGVTVYQQFACARCGSKQTMDTPNTFYICGRCEGVRRRDRHPGRRLHRRVLGACP